MTNPETSRPFKRVNIEISNICNLKCSFCPEVIRPKELMSVELFEKVIREVGPLTEQITLHLMGEPLVHPKLSEIVALCAQYSTPIFLVSNGILLREHHQKTLLDPAFRQINFSLHSFPDNFPDRDPQDYLEKIFSFTERAFELRPDLYINYRLWNLQRPDEVGTRNLEILSAIESRFQVQVSRTPDVRLHRSRKLVNRLYLQFDTEFVWPDLSLPVLGQRGTCHGLSTHFGVLVDGTVVPCCLDKEGQIPLGSLASQPIGNILSQPRAREILAGFKRGDLIEPLCQRCNYIERFEGKLKSLVTRQNLPTSPVMASL